MKHTPLGYNIVGGKAVINEEEATIVRKICDNYLSGMSMTAAARGAGVDMVHTRVRHLMQDKRYLGDDFYPPILTEEIIQAVEEERLKREAEYKGTRYRKVVDLNVPTKFRISAHIPEFKNPVEQVEYAYSLIEREV